MSDASAAGVRRIQFGGRSVRQQLRGMIGRMMDRHSVSKALFFADSGKLKPEAEEWFARLADDNFVMSSAFHEDPREHARNEGRRELALEIINSAGLDLARLGQLKTQLRKEEGNG